MNKSRKKIAQDYSRNAMADAKSSNPKIRKDGKYEAKQAVKAAAELLLEWSLLNRKKRT